MERFIAAQTLVFGWAAVLGLALGIVYDLLFCVRRAFGGGRRAQNLMDILCCAVGLGLFLLFLLTVAEGEFRGYIPLGAALGLALYMLTLSRLMRGWMLPVFRALRRAISLCRQGILRAFSPPRGN